MPAPARAIALTHSPVYLRRPRSGDESVFCDAVRRSRRLHSSWVRPPDTPEKYQAFLARCRRPAFCSYLVCRRVDDVFLGVIDLSEIVRSIFQSAYLGYYAFEPYAHLGYMRFGVHLLLRHAFRDIGLHRLEANIQPTNARSIAFVQAAGFKREGFSPRYLKLGGRWRDHERWALLNEDWISRERALR